MFQRILVATDGTDTATVALDRAAALAKVCGASLTILAAGPPARTESVLDAARARVAPLEADVCAVDRDAASAIVEEAERGGYDLVVLGNRGMTGPDRLETLGSVPNKVSHHLLTSLLIVSTA
jgi:nucleotide-binding universal stress UspA family protein